MIELRHIQKTYPSAAHETAVLMNLSLVVQAGEFVAIMGPSGCGKSTLLNLLGLLDDIDDGQYVFNQTDVTRLSERQKDQFRHRHIGIIFQRFNLIDELSIYENVELPLVYAGVASQERSRRVTDLLEQLRLMHRRHHRPAQLSGGQQQRTAIARALAVGPSLLLADEPTGNLDSVNREAVMRLLTDINEAGTTIIMVTHSELDALYAHRIVRMLDGQLMD
ncbi:ABC transporter ATP-binding protein [Spirosoma rhododendri]|uniref:ABC transporter ATP-binding protein n=1 Tax=Spirosoma rhododendri TaxID=2728024 RepID=A0A7L5DST2_9BACT|nr:ABC transporter ATP-binding protein [Spirosoma rhododendri]QJD81534.1 ABC transporter ATP-binding protein [Spirosoma rhododendri]